MSPSEEFAEASQYWDLEKLYADLATAKKIWAPHARKGLSDTEKLHLRGLLCGYSPDDIAKKLYKNAAGVKTSLSETLYRYAENLTKRPPNTLNNWQDIVDWLEVEYKIKSFPAPDSLREDWEGAPDVSTFYGRAEELATLSEWIAGDSLRDSCASRCRLVAILGLGGIGKTTLATKLAKQLQDKFEYVIWRNLPSASPFTETLSHLLQFFYPQYQEEFSDSINNGISQLIKKFQQHRCLLILDGVETILQPGSLAGQYHPEGEAYQQLISRLARESHQSCLVLTSREKSKEIASLSGPNRPVRTKELSGLGEAAADILKDKGIQDYNNWKSLINLYRGNPLALKIVATTIHDVFGGSVDEFLRHSSVFVGDFSDILDQQFQRLSPLEKEVLYGLALERQPVSLYALRETACANIPVSELIRVVESLTRRSLLETTRNGKQVQYTLQPIVMKYITNQLIDEISRDILVAMNNRSSEIPALLRSQILRQFQSRSHSDDKIANYRFIQVQIKDNLQTIFQSQNLGDFEKIFNQSFSAIPQLSILE